MSEQNSPAEPAHAQSSFGSAPDSPSLDAPGPGPAAAEQVGTEQVGTAPHQAGPPPDYTQAFGAAPAAGAASQTVGTAPEAPMSAAPEAPTSTAPEAPTSTAPAKDGRTGRIVLQAVAVIAILVIAGLIGLFLKSLRGPVTYKVGDCLNSQATSSSDATKTRKVDCGSGDASVKVVGVVDGLTRQEFDAGEPPCKAYPTAVSALWIGDKGTGKTYCLEPVN